MSSQGTSVQLGGSFGGLLFVTFLVLKLTGTIGWSWWWVTCPLWLGPAVLLFALFIGVLLWNMR